ncbi:tetratricopeptide repeat protein [Geobacter sp. OR-1]|uniref:peptidase MA family metallohydrolase n=1 Tax=Geobacter sp. OR-1 TaxID=1266765 RepID=UPI0005A7AB1C|nr:tetratricopeptide repeat protein [Geobacter sp. OR-1]
MAIAGTSRTATASDPLLLNDYALQLVQKGEIEKALENLQQASSLFPYDLVLKKNLAEVYTLLGNRLISEGKYQEAARVFDNAAELFPDNQRYRVLSAIGLYSAKQYDAAIVELESARGMGGDSVDLLLILGRAHYDNGNLRSAIEVWEKALEIQPGHKEILSLTDKARRELAVEEKMDKGFSSRFVVSFDAGGSSKLADSILDVLESAYNRVGSDLNHFPNMKIPVLIYTKSDYRTLTKSPDWSGGLYDGKIRLPVGGASDMNSILSSLLFHEYTHVVVQDLTSGNCPMWLNEGLAELEGRRDFSHPLKELEIAVKQKSILPLSTMERSFAALNPKEAALAYQQSYSFVKYIISTFGWHKIKDILLNLGAGKGITDAVSSALSDLTLDYQAVYQEWLASLDKQYGK